jgi:hypothetical protein
MGIVSFIHVLLTASLLVLVLQISISAEALLRMFKVRGGYEIAGPMGQGFDVACDAGAMISVRASQAWKFLIFPAVASAVSFIAWPSSLAATMNLLRRAAMNPLPPAGSPNPPPTSPFMLARPGGAWYILLAATVLLCIAVHESLQLERSLSAPTPPALAAPAAAWPPPKDAVEAHEKRAAEEAAGSLPVLLPKPVLPNQVAVVAQ